MQNFIEMLGRGFAYFVAGLFALAFGAFGLLIVFSAQKTGNEWIDRAAAKHQLEEAIKARQ